MQSRGVSVLCRFCGCGTNHYSLADNCLCGMMQAWTLLLYCGRFPCYSSVSSFFSPFDEQVYGWYFYYALCIYVCFCIGPWSCSNRIVLLLHGNGVRYGSGIRHDSNARSCNGARDDSSTHRGNIRHSSSVRHNSSRDARNNRGNCKRLPYQSRLHRLL